MRQYYVTYFNITRSWYSAKKKGITPTPPPHPSLQEKNIHLLLPTTHPPLPTHPLREHPYNITTTHPSAII